MSGPLAATRKTSVTSGKPVLVTGAKGLVGRAIVDALLRRGDRVRALSRPTRDGAPLAIPWPASERLEIVVGDLTDATAIAHAVHGVAGIVHAGGVKNDERDSEAVNVGGAQHLVAAALDSRIHFVINISTQSVKLRRPGVYARTKLEAERVFAASGLPVTTLRPSVVYRDTDSGVIGVVVRFCRGTAGRSIGVPIIGEGRVTFAPIHADDLAQMVIAAIDRPASRGQVYDVGGPTQLDFVELVDLVSAQLGVKRRHLHIPIPMAMAIARACRWLPVRPITVSNVRGAIEPISVDVHDAIAQFDVMPRQFADGLASVFRAHRDRSSEREAELLLRYVAGRRRRLAVDAQLLADYERALIKECGNSEPILDAVVHRVPRLLSAIDALSCWLLPESPLRSRLFIAASLVECRTQSAAWWLPKSRSRIGAGIGLMRVLLSAAARVIASFPFLLWPGFVRRNAGVV